jgi:acetyl-CoA synthetase (ADP-forming)
MMDRIQTAVSALDALRRRTQWLDKVRTSAKPVAARDARRPNGTDLGDAPNLTEDEAYRLLSSFGIEVAPYHVAGSAGEARSASTRLGYPTVMKILSRDIIHKSDVHGVVTGIGSEDEAGKAYDDLLERVRQHVNSPVGGTVIVSKQLAGLELIIGYMRDPHFGPVVMAGIGGIFVEVLKDVSIRLAPVTLEDATEMLAELKAAPLLFGARNQSALNVDAVARILVNLGEVGISLPAISEIDLNPVFASRESATVADARIIIDRNGQVEN